MGLVQALEKEIIMPVALGLNHDQWSVLEQALKGKNIANLQSHIRTVQLTTENVIPIRDAVKALHNKKFRIKTKTVEHIETCLYCEQIIKRINSLLYNFPDVAANDADVGLVDTSTNKEEIKGDVGKEMLGAYHRFEDDGGILATNPKDEENAASDD